LEHDVFEKPSFIIWAKSNVILLELDFPRRKQLPPELVQQNNSLQQAFQVQGYPTVWYFSVTQDAASGKMNLNAYGSQGYPAGSQQGKEDEAFLNAANEIIAKAKAEAAKATAETKTTAKPATKAKK
jgi:protein disulfide-isomerase